MNVVLRKGNLSTGVYIEGDASKFKGTVEFRDTRGIKYDKRVSAQITENGQRLLRELIEELEKQGLEIFK